MVDPSGFDLLSLAQEALKSPSTPGRPARRKKPRALFGDSPDGVDVGEQELSDDSASPLRRVPKRKASGDVELNEEVGDGEFMEDVEAEAAGASRAGRTAASPKRAKVATPRTGSRTKRSRGRPPKSGNRKGGKSQGLDALSSLVSPDREHKESRKGRVDERSRELQVQTALLQEFQVDAQTLSGGGPTDPELLSEQQSMVNHSLCGSKVKKRLRKFAQYEWFYAHTDRLFFMQNEFVDCLDSMKLAHLRQMTRTEWSHVRSKVGKPRRLSAAFFAAERHKLDLFRRDVHNIQQGKVVNTSLIPVPEEVPARLIEGQKVVSLHPETRELHTGVILGMPRVTSLWTGADYVESIQYRVKFDRKEFGSHMIPDTHIMLQGGSKPLLMSEWNSKYPLPMFPGSSASDNLHLPMSGNAVVSTEAPFPHGHGDISRMAAALRLLDRKQALVDHLRLMNDEAEVAASDRVNQPPLSNMFKQQYAWVIIQLEHTSHALEHALLQLRIRQRGSMQGTSARPLEDELATYTPESMTIVGVCHSNAQDLVQRLLKEMTQRRSATAPNSTSSKEIHELIASCIALVNLIKMTNERGLAPTAFESVVKQLKPKSARNQAIYQSIQQSVSYIQTSLSC